MSFSISEVSSYINGWKAYGSALAERAQQRVVEGAKQAEEALGSATEYIQTEVAQAEAQVDAYAESVATTVSNPLDAVTRIDHPANVLRTAAQYWSGKPQVDEVDVALVAVTGVVIGVVVPLALTGCHGQGYDYPSFDANLRRELGSDVVAIGEDIQLTCVATGRDNYGQEVDISSYDKTYSWSVSRPDTEAWETIEGEKIKANSSTKIFNYFVPGDYAFTCTVEMDGDSVISTQQPVVVQSGVLIFCEENCSVDYTGDKAVGYIGDVLQFQVEYPYNTSDYEVTMQAFDRISGEEVFAEGTSGEGARQFYFSGKDSFGDAITAYVVSAEITELVTGDTFAVEDKAVEIASRRVPAITLTGNEHYLGAAEEVLLTIAPEVDNFDIMPAWTCDWTFEAGTVSDASCDGATLYFNAEATGAILSVRVIDDRGTVVADTADSSSQTALYVSRRSAMVSVDDASQVYTGQERNFSCSVSPEFTDPLYEWTVSKDGVVDSTPTDQELSLSFAEEDAYATYTLLCRVSDPATGTVMAYDGYNNEYIFTVLSASDGYNCEEYSPPSFLATEMVSTETSIVAGSDTLHQTYSTIVNCGDQDGDGLLDAIEPTDCGVGYYTESDDATIAALPACSRITVYGDLVYDSTTTNYEWWGYYSAADKKLYVEGVPLYNLVGTNRLAITATNSEGLTSSPTNVDLPYLVARQITTPSFIEVRDTFNICFGGSGGESIEGTREDYYIYESIFENYVSGSSSNCLSIYASSTGIGDIEANVTLYNNVLVSATDSYEVF